MLHTTTITCNNTKNMTNFVKGENTREIEQRQPNKCYFTSYKTYSEQNEDKLY